MMKIKFTNSVAELLINWKKQVIIQRNKHIWVERLHPDLEENKNGNYICFVMAPQWFIVQKNFVPNEISQVRLAQEMGSLKDSSNQRDAII